MEYLDYIIAGVMTLVISWTVYVKMRHLERCHKREKLIDNFGFKSLRK